MPVLSRLLIGAPLAALFALILFLAMRSLIAVTDVEVAEATTTPVIDINPRVADIEPTKRTDPPPAEEAKIPPRVELTLDHSANPGAAPIALATPLPPAERPVLTSEINFVAPDRDAAPTVRVPPAYPPMAQEQGLEGACTMQFDVLPDGTTANVTALECSSSVFARPSVRAVQQWRYAPKVVDGAAVGRAGLVTTLDYVLAN